MVDTVVGVTKMGNNVPRAGLEHTYLALQHVGSLMAPLYPRLHVYADPYLRGSVQTTTIHRGHSKQK